MNILALSSSPREHGNTDLLLDELLRGIRESQSDNPQNQSYNIEKFRLSNLHIQPCTQCDYCREHGECSIKDDMEQLYPRLIAAQWLILASPIYFMAHCAQAKLVIDRCQVFWARKHILKRPLSDGCHSIRRGVFVSVGATHGSKVFAGVKITMKWFFDALEMEYWDNLLFEGIDKKAVVREHPTALKQAYELGRRMAQS